MKNKRLLLLLFVFIFTLSSCMGPEVPGVELPSLGGSEKRLTLDENKIAVFNNGYIEQIGTPNEIYNHSASEFVCNFIGDVNKLSPETVNRIIASGADISAQNSNYVRLERIHVNVAPATGEVTFEGKVVRREYYGLYIKYHIDIGFQQISVIYKNDGVCIYEPGQIVTAVLNPKDIMAYPAKPETPEEAANE